MTKQYLKMADIFILEAESNGPDMILSEREGTDPSEAFKYISHAINSHDELVQRCKDLDIQLEDATKQFCELSDKTIIRGTWNLYVGQLVKKVTGDFKLSGIVRAVFRDGSGSIRLVVEHTVRDRYREGSFLYIYSPSDLEPLYEGGEK